MRNIALIIILIGISLAHLSAQRSYKYNFDRYANEQGLSQGQVFDITQDQAGQIWIATYSGGVTILDGISEKYLTQKNGLPSYSTTSLLLDHKNRMWIGTSNGPCYYNGYTIKRPHISEEIKKLFVWDVAADQNHQIWLATDQGIWYIKNDTAYPADKTIMQYPFYRISKQPGDGSLWFFSGFAGIRKLNNDQLHKIKLPVTDGALIETLIFSSSEHAYAGTTKGLFEIKLSRRDTTLVNHYISDHHITCGDIDEHGRLWVGTDEAGLYIFNTNGEKQNISAYQGIGHNRVYKIFRDKKNSIWIGTDGAGAYLFKGFRFSELRIKELFQPSFIMGVHFDKQDNLWVTSEGQGAVKIGKNKNTHYTINNGLNSNFTKDVTSDSKGNIYISTYNGITVIKKNKITYLRSPADMVTNLIEVVFVDHKDRAWAGTLGHGVQCINTKKLYSSANGLVSDYIWDIYESRNHKKLYIATDEGINIIENGKITDTINRKDGMRNQVMSSIIQDSHGNMWFASEGGLTWYNHEKLIYYPINELCSNNIIYSIIEDRFGRLLIGTENGIVLLVIDEYGTIHSTHQFSKNTGFFGIECNSNAVTKNKDGQIFWGTVNGVTRHIPSKKWHTNMVAQPYIRSVELNDETVRIHNYADSIKPWFNLPENLKLPYNQNNITIHYGAPEFYYNDKLLYRYKLQGLDDDWSKPTKQTQVSYNHLAAGNYKFQVQTLHKDFIGKPAGTNNFTFLIKTPFYQTWWFRIIFSITIISMALLFWNYRIYALRQRKVTLQKLVRERTRQLSTQKNQLEKANREIKRSARLKEQFLANTSHEMRTPLNVIIGYGNLLLNSSLTSQQKTYMENIRSSGEHLKVIINDLLDLSKIEADKVELNKTTFNYRRIILNTFNIFRIEAENKGLKANLNIQRPINQVVGDPVRLTQIISNLLRNAIKFTEKGSVGISTREIPLEENKIKMEIRVTDTGIGIPKDKLSHIFNSFTQVTGDLTRKYGGTGLGLSIVQKLVTLHKGKINVWSKPEEGTTFLIEIPYQISKEEEQPLVDDYQIQKAQSLNHLRILIVDDNEINLSLAIETLHRFNDTIKTDVAYNGKEALIKHNEADFDLIIMDIQMPEMDGYEATKNIRNQKGAKGQIPILGMTAHAMKDERSKCLDLGMNEYLSKPFSPSELLQKIGEVLELSIETGTSESKTRQGSNLKTIDISKIKQIVGDSIEKEHKYLKMLQTNAPNLIKKIESGLQNKNLQDAKVAAHSLKSTFRYYGAHELMELSRKIEELSSNGNNHNEDINSYLERIKEQWKAVAAELEAYFEMK